MKKQYTKLNDQGLVSMIVVFLLMIIITIITLSFASTVRREQRQSVDRQLEQQAYYAAESGINMAQNALKNPATASLTSITPKTNCEKGIVNSIYGSLDGKIDDAGDTSYTCLLIDPTPASLQYDLSPTAGAKAMPLSPSIIAQNLDKVTINWAPSTTAANPLDGCKNAADAKFKSSTSEWACGYAVLRLDMVYTTSAITRSDLIKNAFSATLVPTLDNPNGDLNYEGTVTNPSGSLTNQGVIANAHCTASACTVNILDLPSNPAYSYYARISSVYHSAKVSITGATDAGGAIKFKDAQVVIDSTGRAQDVYKRIQVRKPSPQNTVSSNSEGNADYGIQTKDSVCKKFQVFPGYSNNTDDTSPGCR